MEAPSLILDEMMKLTVCPLLPSAFLRFWWRPDLCTGLQRNAFSYQLFDKLFHSVRDEDSAGIDSRLTYLNKSSSACTTKKNHPSQVAYFFLSK